VKFADSGWWIAWSLPHDSRHDDAVEMLDALGRNEQVLATNRVVGETWTYLRRKGGHRSAIAFLDRVETLVEHDRLVLHRVTDEQERSAWEWLRRHDERSYSFVDATSFRVMRDRRLREVLAFDQDFTSAGFLRVGAGTAREE
jgi:predicted nucleic acid-binding protein